MSIKHLLLKTFIVAVLLLSVSAVLLFTMDLGRFKGLVERYVSNSVGRDFSIQGELSIRIGKTVEFEAAGLRLANPAWAASPDLARVGTLRGSVDLRSLLDGPVKVESLELQGVEIWAEVSADGEKSWVPKDSSTSINVTDKPGPQVLFRKVEVNDLEGHLDHPALKSPLVLVIDSFTQRHLQNDMLDLALAGQINGQPVEYQGILGPFASLMTGQDIRYDGEGLFGSLSVKGHGTMDDLAAPRHPEFKLELSGPDISEVTEMLRIADLGAGPFQLTAQVQKSDDEMDIKLDGVVGEFNIDLEGRTTAIADFTRAQFQVAASGPDLGALTRLLGLGAWPSEPFDLSGSVRRDGQRLDIDTATLMVGTTRMAVNGALSRFPQLQDSQVEVEIRGDDVEEFHELLGLKGVATGPFVINANLGITEDGQEVVDFVATTSMGSINVSGTLGPGPGYEGSIFRLLVKGNNVRKLMDAMGAEGFPDDPFNLDTVFAVRENGLDFEKGVLLTLGDDRMEISGFVSFTPLERGTDIRVRLSGDNVAEITPILQADLQLPERAYNISGRFQAVEEGYRFSELKGTIGQGQITIDGLFTRNEGLVGSDFTFSAIGRDLEDLLADTPFFDIPAHSFKTSGRVQLLEKSVSIQELEVEIGELKASGDLDIHLPLDSFHGRFNIEASGPDVRVLLPEFDRYVPEADPFRISARGRWSEGAWTFENASVQIDDAVFSLSGVLDEFPDFSATNLAFEAVIPDPSSLGQIDGEKLPALPVELSAHFSGTVDEFLMDRLTARIGDSDFQGELRVSYKGEKPDITLQSHSRLIDLEPFLGEEGLDQAVNAGAAGDGRLIPDINFPLKQLAVVDAHIEIDADEVRLENTQFRNVTVLAELKDGGIVVKQFRGEGAGGYIEGDFSLRPLTDKLAELSAVLKLDGLILNLAQLSPEDIHKLPAFYVDLNIKGRGEGLRQVAASLQGNFEATSTGGIVPGFGLVVVYAPILSQVFSFLRPKDQNEGVMQLECFAIRLDAVDGLVETNPLVTLRTRDIRLISSGTIQLATEAIDLNFEAHATKAYSATFGELVNPFVKITGTLAAPALSLNAGGALLYSGVAIGTGGLSILAKAALDRLRGTTDPCEKLAEEINARRQTSDPNHAETGDQILGNITAFDISDGVDIH